MFIILFYTSWLTKPVYLFCKYKCCTNSGFVKQNMFPQVKNLNCVNETETTPSKKENNTLQHLLNASLEILTIFKGLPHLENKSNFGTLQWNITKVTN